MGYFSNGTEGAIYEEQFCSRCVHYDHEPGVDKPCPVWMSHLLWAYELCNEDPKTHPGKMMLDTLIPQAEDGITNLECAMFVDAAGFVPVEENA